MMQSLLTSLYDSVREDLGVPGKLLRLLDDRPEICVQISEPTSVIDATSVVQWHKWGDSSPFRWPRRGAGWVVGWKHSGGTYNSFESNLAPLAAIGQYHCTVNWACDIQDVSGLGASKSKLTNFACLDDMVEQNSPEMIDEITEEKLRDNLAHSEIRILHNADTSDHFARHQWDGRVFLMNDGGSHHFAAARYIAARIVQRVPLQGKLYTYSINESSVHALRCDFDLHVISDEPVIVNAFHDAMHSFKATYLQRDMPRPYEKMRAILLPKNEPRSARVSKVLRQAGAFDLGEHLADLCGRQSKRMAA
jgi:hypothetical protein